MSHMYAIARQLQAPGVKTVATFNPTRLTMTLRNMVRKSIATGNHNGGWSSKTRDVRELVFNLAGERPIVYVQQASDYMTFCISRPITSDNLSEMIGLLEADCTLQKMDYDDTNKSRYHPTRSEFYKTIDERHDQSIAKLKFAEQGKAHNLIVRNSKIRQQIAEAFLKERTIEEIAIAERIARYLDNDLEYNVPTTHEF
jgi:hypothetical protein